MRFSKLVILFKLKIKENENDTSGRIEEADSGT